MIDKSRVELAAYLLFSIVANAKANSMQRTKICTTRKLRIQDIRVFSISPYELLKYTNIIINRLKISQHKNYVKSIETKY